MIKLVDVTEKDRERLVRWTESDPYRHSLNPEWWFTGSGMLSFCAYDSIGPVAYVRLDPKDSFHEIRLHTQFAPESEVSKIRLVRVILECIPIVVHVCKSNEAKFLVFQSVSPMLIRFMCKHFGFKLAGGDDYSLQVGD